MGGKAACLEAVLAEPEFFSESFENPHQSLPKLWAHTETGVGEILLGYGSLNGDSAV